MGEGRNVAAQLRCFSLYRYGTIRDTILSDLILQCEIFLRLPVKISVQVLAAGCHLSYRKFYGFFFTVQNLSVYLTEISYGALFGPWFSDLL